VHELRCTGNVRVAPPTSAGGPKDPLNPNPTRVSAIGQGVIGLMLKLEQPGGAKYPLMSIRRFDVNQKVRRVAGKEADCAIGSRV
jgi:hypothetical protein